MGFSCGIYWAPKINEDITLHEIDSVQIYYDYFHNEWAQKNYSTAEGYLKSRGYSMPSQDLIDFYIPYIHYFLLFLELIYLLYHKHSF